MLRKTALRLSGGLARRGIVNADDMDVYAYGLELVLSAAVSILLIIIVSILFLKPLSWLIFLLPFIPIRLTAGGYHANSHLKCFVVFTGAYTVFILTAVLTSTLVTPLLLTTVSAISFGIILLLSPLQSDSKPLSEEERRRNRRRSIVISLLCLFITAISIFVGSGFLMAFTFFTLGQLAAALSLIVAKITYK